MPEFDFANLLYNCGVMILAFLLAMPIAWDRERSRLTLGLRTFPLVAVASTGFILLARSVLAGDPAGEARILQGLITGIGFLGGGVIVHQGADVQGTATAASIWNMAALGAAVAYQHFEIAVLLCIINFVTLRWLRRASRELERQVEEKDGH